MPIKEGRCPNCGSIIHLDADAAKGHCLFCDAVIETEQALTIAEIPSAYTSPNLPHPKFEGPSLDPEQGERSGKGGQAQLKKPKKPRPAPPPVYVPKEPVKLPEIRVPGRIKLRILLICLAVVLIAAGISVPVVMKRNEIRQGLLASIDELAPFSLNAEKEVDIWFTTNSYLMAATKDQVSREDMISFFKAYCEKRAELAGIDPQDFANTYGAVTVKLVYPEGGYQIKQPRNQADLLEGTAVTVLP